MLKEVILYSYQFNLRKWFGYKKDIKVDTLVIWSSIFLMICSPFLLILLSSNLNDNYQILLGILISFLIINYDKPIINSIFNRDEYKMFKLNKKVAISYCAINMIIKNPLVIMLLIYLLENLIINFNSASIIVVIVALLQFLLVYIKPIFIKTIIWGYIATLILININIPSNEFKLLSILIGSILSGIFYFKITNYLLIKESNIEMHWFNKINGIIFWPFKALLIGGIKKYIAYLVILAAYWLATTYWNLHFIVLPIFLLIFDCELLLDYRFKYLNQYQSKYYLLIRSSLNPFQRFTYSDYYIYFIKYLVMLIIVFFKINIIKWLILVLLLSGLAFGYYKLEDRMMINNRKSNTLLCQYLIFILVMTIICLI